MFSRFFKKLKKAKVVSEHSSGEMESEIKKVLEKTAYSGGFKNILEIGSRDGLDAFKLSKFLKVPSQEVYIAEANPECFSFIKKTYPSFQVVNKAIFNKETTLDFNYVYRENIGTSSLLDRNDDYYADKSKKIKISSITGKTLLQHFNLEEVGFCKIDVEGATFEVLESFGADIKKISFLHLECEHVEIWQNEILFPEIEKYLIIQGFQLFSFGYVGDVERQSDSVWVNSKVLKNS